MSGQQWSSYLKRITGDAKGLSIASKVGASSSKVSYWLRGERPPTPREAVHVARMYDRPPLEGLVAAGLLSHDEAALGDDVHIHLPADLSSVPTADLLAEVVSRIPSTG